MLNIMVIITTTTVLKCRIKTITHKPEDIYKDLWIKER